MNQFLPDEFLMTYNDWSMQENLHYLQHYNFDPQPTFMRWTAPLRSSLNVDLKV